MILKWTFGGDYPNTITFTKARGKITFEDICDTLASSNFISMFSGAMIVWAKRVMDEPYDGWYDSVCAKKGDEVTLHFMNDEENHCPVCGNQGILQYCPDCGRKLFGKENQHV